jgi:catechol 2,3-dioxygenase-like lactoylglutathione lyase family enzyme
MADSTLGIRHAFSGFAVPDLQAAKSFYSGTLGLDVTEEMMGLLRLNLPGGGEVMVYPKPDHQPAAFTILNFVVDDIDAAVDTLTAAGVTFERYDGFEQDEKGIARPPEENQGPPIAWFTDPAGNILAVLQSA